MPRLPAFDPRKQSNQSPHVVILGAGAKGDLRVYLARRPGKVINHRLLAAIWGGQSTEQYRFEPGE